MVNINERINLCIYSRSHSFGRDSYSINNKR